MRPYVVLCGGVVALLLIMLGVVYVADIALLTEPAPVLDRLGAVAALIAVALLVADVALPVPSSLLMIWLGAAHGWAAGAALSLAGCLGAACLAFWLGRRSARILARRVSPIEKARADRALHRWGPLVVALSRPVPILAETTALVAGTSPMRWRALVVASLAGSAPIALLYGLIGAALL